MARPNASTKLEPAARREAHKAAQRAATVHRRIQERQRRHDEAVAKMAAQRDAAWREATDLGMSRTEAASIAGLHHSAVDRALS